MSIDRHPASGTSRRLTTNARGVTALLLIGLAYGFSRLPEPTAEDRRAQARKFSFVRAPILPPASRPMRTIRTVHPSLTRIAAWISSVGAAVALADLDGNGRPDDACIVDPRTDDVWVAPLGRERGAIAALALDPWVDRDTMAPMGCLPGDFNEDGRPDLLVYFWGRTPLLFLRSHRSYVAHPLLQRDERWYTNAATQADLDGDGHADLVLANYFPDGAAILDGAGRGLESMQASMSRARNGGHKHVFLWKGVADGEPRAVSYTRADGLPAETSGTWTLALAATDLDGDLRPELYFANDFGPDNLLHNESTPGRLRFTSLYGQRSFTTPRSKVVGRDSFKGMGADFADLNRDAVPDLVVSNIAAPYALQESHFVFLSTGAEQHFAEGIAPYVDRSERLGLARSGWAWDVKVDDFNNDGVLEIVQATGFVRGSASRWPELQELATGNDQLLRDPRSWPDFGDGADLSGADQNPFFVRHSDGRYYDLSTEVGLAGAFVSRGIAVADVDGDGRLDFALANQWQAPTFVANRAPDPGAFLGLRLLRPLDDQAPFTVLPGRPAHLPPATAAVGAVARVRLPNAQSLLREVDGGNGHSGKRSAELHFGLGAMPAEARVPVLVRWRDRHGAVQSREIRVTPGWHTVLLGR